MQTLAEIRANIADTTRESQINSLIDSFINMTLMEMNDPAWAFESVAAFRGYNHLWTFNKRKHTFSTVASTEFYQLPRDVDKISLIRQTTSPMKLLYVPDEVFYKFIPNPTATGNPLYYRLWEEEGVSTRLATDDTIQVVSSSASDNSNFTVSVVGYDTNGIVQSESFSLNGITAVNGTKTFDAGRPLKISKSAATTGNITIKEKTSGTTLVILGPEERSPRFKVIGMYPIPSSAITISLEYYTRIRRVINSQDVPDIDEKWIWIVRLGALAKVYQYQNKPADYIVTQQNLYAAGVRSMVKADMQMPDYIPVLRNQKYWKQGIIELADEEYALTF